MEGRHQSSGGSMLQPVFCRGYGVADYTRITRACDLLEQAGVATVRCKYEEARDSFIAAVYELEKGMDCMPLEVCVAPEHVRTDLAPHPQARAVKEGLDEAARMFRRSRLGPAVDCIVEAGWLLSDLLYPEDD